MVEEIENFKVGCLNKALYRGIIGFMNFEQIKGKHTEAYKARISFVDQLVDYMLKNNHSLTVTQAAKIGFISRGTAVAWIAELEAMGLLKLCDGAIVVKGVTFEDRRTKWKNQTI